MPGIPSQEQLSQEKYASLLSFMTHECIGHKEMLRAVFIDLVHKKQITQSDITEMQDILLAQTPFDNQKLDLHINEKIEFADEILEVKQIEIVHNYVMELKKACMKFDTQRYKGKDRGVMNEIEEAIELYETFHLLDEARINAMKAQTEFHLTWFNMEASKESEVIKQKELAQIEIIKQKESAIKQLKLGSLPTFQGLLENDLQEWVDYLADKDAYTRQQKKNHWFFSEPEWITYFLEKFSYLRGNAKSKSQDLRSLRIETSRKNRNQLIQKENEKKDLYKSAFQKGSLAASQMQSRRASAAQSRGEESVLRSNDSAHGVNRENAEKIKTEQRMNEFFSPKTISILNRLALFTSTSATSSSSNAFFSPACVVMPEEQSFIMDLIGDLIIEDGKEEKGADAVENCMQKLSLRNKSTSLNTLHKELAILLQDNQHGNGLMLNAESAFISGFLTKDELNDLTSNQNAEDSRKIKPYHRKVNFISRLISSRSPTRFLPVYPKGSKLKVFIDELMTISNQKMAKKSQ